MANGRQASPQPRMTSLDAYAAACLYQGPFSMINKSKLKALNPFIFDEMDHFPTQAML